MITFSHKSIIVVTVDLKTTHLSSIGGVMYLSLVIPVHNAYGYVKKALKSVLNNFDFESGEVLVVDDCSDMRTARLIDKFLAKFPDKLKLIRNSSKLGYLQSCNQAVNQVRGDIVVLLNSDCEIPKGFCERVRRCFESDENIMAASPISSHSATYSMDNILPLEVMNSLLKKRRKPQYPDIYNAEGFCFCVRKDYINKHGLFDPVYGVGYCEEVDFCFGVKSRGFRCVLIDNLYVKHAKNKSFGNTRTAVLAQNNQILYEKWADFIHFGEFLSVENPMTSIIKDVFGLFRVFVLFNIRFRRQIETNRIKTLKNLCKVKGRSGLSKKVVYTAIVGNYDIMPVIQDYVREGWRYVCFTDNKTLLRLGRFAHWEIKPLRFTELDSTKNARWHKTHNADLFPDCAESLWVDANINILTPYIFELVENANSDLLVPKHYCRKSVYQELEAVNALSLETFDNIKFIDKFLHSEGMPDNFGLNETNLLYRQHNQRTTKLMQDWWHMIEHYSKRDQLSFSYVLWKNSINVNDISIPNARIDTQNFKIFTHNPSNTITGKFLSLIFNSK